MNFETAMNIALGLWILIVIALLFLCGWMAFGKETKTPADRQGFEPFDYTERN